jgi:hypothetical protein
MNGSAVYISTRGSRSREDEDQWYHLHLAELLAIHWICMSEFIAMYLDR